MSAPTLPTDAAELVTLARLTRLEYEARILLQACFRTLDTIPDEEVTDRDRKWRDDMYRAWWVAWEALAAAGGA